jgi:hypothetical protein
MSHKTIGTPATAGVQFKVAWIPPGAVKYPSSFYLLSIVFYFVQTGRWWPEATLKKSITKALYRFCRNKSYQGPEATSFALPAAEGSGVPGEWLNRIGLILTAWNP